MLIRFALFIALLSAPKTLFAQAEGSLNISPKKAVRQMARVGILKCELVGRAPIMPQQYLRFDLLRKQSTDAELTALLKHRAPVVRAYAFEALAERPNIDLFPLLLRHQQDTARLAVSCGCFRFNNTVIDNMLFEYGDSPQYAQDMSVINKKAAWENLREEFSQRASRKRERNKQLTPYQKIKEDKRLSAHDDE